MGQITRKDRNW